MSTTALPLPPSPTAPSTLRSLDDRTWVLAAEGGDAIELLFAEGPVVVTDIDGEGRRWVLPSGAGPVSLSGSGSCWVLPPSPTADEPAWHLTGEGVVEATAVPGGTRVLLRGDSATLRAHRARPHADVDGGEFDLDLEHGGELADAAAAFYWGTMLPSVIERTVAAGFADSSGFVVSTLADKYVGTYPDVDHEFQIKGRVAWGDRTDDDVVRRMIELQLRVMREDPQELWRDPCAIQPNGDREYHVRRSSVDGSANAEMFLVTGNVEVLESIWLHVARTKDLAWLAANIADIEGAASAIEDCVDRQGRLWSDVYYEDQVIKDGRETMAAALAVHSFRLLAELEAMLDRDDRAGAYRSLAERIASTVGAPVPFGHWDDDARRFVDWVDRSGVVHDHIHLLANVLPVVLGLASAEQTSHVIDLVDAELDEFQRFPTFLAARIADYTDDEIGDAGPYDLCAAGRYWSWDAAFWSWRRDGAMLLDQLRRVAAQGALDDFAMGERYDMDHVYYVDGSPWHGAAHYYEYPCVFSWVLFTEYLGIKPSLTADLAVTPRLTGTGRVSLGQQAYRLAYTVDGDSFTLVNEADHARTFEIDLRTLRAEAPEPYVVEIAAGASHRAVLDGERVHA
ncbi:hypothetical protein [Frondihabitans australicus]|uniref:Uncharacterized protein n=1 Tax=Frondihabitans australicus TaxID=386892 RepID=A0A495IKF5_9MICO|nr:hypothetical protein [Frondihabitans australicus]RKR76447.1 hypothetical protein C8E83_3623 [Frondihabitans australicus]